MKYDKVHNIYNKLLTIDDIDPTLVYIQYMKFARRAEGIKSGRTIFKKAREDPRTRHHVYVTAALMEYYCSKASARQEPEQHRNDLAVGIQSSLCLVFFPTQDKSVAFKIFELGLKKYGDIPEYILAYIDYLSHLNGSSRVANCPVKLWRNLWIALGLPSKSRNSKVSLFSHFYCHQQRTTTRGSCLNASSPREACLKKSRGNEAHSLALYDGTK